MTYTRVLPRDLFNEAKLLKCIGKLILLKDDGKLPWLRCEYDNDERFLVEQDSSDGSISVSNIHFYLYDGCKLVDLHFYTPLNDKSAWPLVVRIKDDDFYVFDNDGELALSYNERMEATQ